MYPCALLDKADPNFVVPSARYAVSFFSPIIVNGGDNMHRTFGDRFKGVPCKKSVPGGNVPRGLTIEVDRLKYLPRTPDTAHTEHLGWGAPTPIGYHISVRPQERMLVSDFKKQLSALVPEPCLIAAGGEHFDWFLNRPTDTADPVLRHASVALRALTEKDGVPIDVAVRAWSLAHHIAAEDMTFENALQALPLSYLEFIAVALEEMGEPEDAYEIGDCNHLKLRLAEKVGHKPVYFGGPLDDESDLTKSLQSEFFSLFINNMFFSCI